MLNRVSDSDFFELSEKKLLVYGAGSMGLKMVNKKALKPFAFVDRRGEELKEFNGYKVLSLSEAFDLEEKESYCLIIAIRDVFSHSQIALEFFNAGFTNIVFKPHSVLNGKSDVSEELFQISSAYDSLTVQNIEVIRRIPCYSGEILFDFENASLIADSVSDATDSDFVKFYAPAELLFANDLYDDSNLWTRRNFCSGYIAVDLYRALQQDGSRKDEEFNRYVKLYAEPGAIKVGVNTGGSWKNTVIETRLSAFNEMKARLATDYNFFIKHCSTVSLLSPCRLQLVKSGKSRVSFLVALRMPYIPVLMQRTEYDKFLNENVAKSVYNYICKNKIAKVPVPVPHPFFYGLKADVLDYAYLWESKVAKTLYDLSFARNQTFETSWLRIFDNSCDCGSLSRYLKNLGFDVRRRAATDEFTCLLDSLFCVNFADCEKQQDENCFVFMSLESSVDSHDLLCRIGKTIEFAFVFMEAACVESLKAALDGDFEGAQIACTVVQGKSYLGMCFRRRQHVAG